jgi:hypothetical protein
MPCSSYDLRTSKDTRKWYNATMVYKMEAMEEKLSCHDFSKVLFSLARRLR